MAKRTPTQIYADLRAAGFNAASATIMTAVALAESAGDDTARGDLGLQDNTWGPSYGLYQVRTLKAQTGTGRDRDVSWLAASDTNQAKAAFDLSGGGRDFSPWTTYTRGSYLQFMGQARAAAVDPGTALGSALGGTGVVATSNPLSAAAGDVVGGVRDIALQGLAVLAGLALVGVGITVAVAPHVAPAVKKAGKVAATAAVL